MTPMPITTGPGRSTAGPVAAPDRARLIVWALSGEPGRTRVAELERPAIVREAVDQIDPLSLETVAAQQGPSR